MATVIVTIPAGAINDWPSFHTVFQTALGFLAGYGRNMNAWIDCMSCVDDGIGGMTQVTVAPGQVLTLRIADAADFRRRCPAQYEELVACTDIVNQRRTDKGEGPVLALQFVD